MKFSVSRTSAYSNDDVQPCDGAVREDCLRRDERLVDDPAVIPYFRDRGAEWYKTGLNHRIENGHIVRDFPDAAWFIDLTGMDALMVFLSVHGRCVIRKIGPFNHPHLEIYDTSRE